MLSNDIFFVILYINISSTDNTMNYPLLTTVFAIIMIGHGFDDFVRSKETNLFGYISNANREMKDESILWRY